MDTRPPFTVGKIPRSKPDEAPKTKVREPLTSNRRVFGTVRNQNAPAAKAEPEKATKKSGIPQKPRKQSTHPAVVHQQIDGTPKKPSENTAEKSVDQNKENLLPEGDASVSVFVSGEGAKTPLKSAFLVTKPRKKSVNFRDDVEDKGDAIARTPLKSPFSIKLAVPGTPYHTAEKCSKCRFDKLETSSYWIAQIRLAESAGKHFVSSDFFRLASECKAEPIRNMKVELKKYLGRHGHLLGKKEWTDLCVGYGIMKEESNASQDNVAEEEGMSRSADAAKIDDDVKEEEEEKQIIEQSCVEDAVKNEKQ